ncbi:MAG TPA: hypothetical protein PLP42_04435 [Acidobacteriota bacterium]|nr:hypothetical protein [Acidobacteriota bacterium]
MEVKTSEKEIKEQRRTAQFLTEGSIAQSLAGAVAIVTAVLALRGVARQHLAPATELAASAALLFEGGAMVAKNAPILSSLREDLWSSFDLASGMTAESMAGLSGLILGVLALLGVAPLTLLSVALMISASGLMLGSAATSRLVRSRVVRDDHRKIYRLVSLAAAMQLLIGLGGVILGIAALEGTAALVLVLAGFLALGASSLLTGLSLTMELWSTEPKSN